MTPRALELLAHELRWRLGGFRALPLTYDLANALVLAAYDSCRIRCVCGCGVVENVCADPGCQYGTTSDRLGLMHLGGHDPRVDRIFDRKLLALPGGTRYTWVPAQA